MQLSEREEHRCSRSTPSSSTPLMPMLHTPRFKVREPFPLCLFSLLGIINHCSKVLLNVLRYMTDPSEVPPSQSGSENPSSRQKKGRRATRLRELTLSRSGEQRIPIEFDKATGNPLGPNNTKFKSYVALLGRSKASILKKDWDDVEMQVKDQIWETIMLTYDVPNTNFLKRKWLSFAGFFG
ncbi:hypothetical protein VNO77_03740 [Canavalia gladiata]|uniref:Uncharacterized protein n=1 Tax=Canavalia gladiata TaxID=3824 RepID=A0AAN9MW34_CANGL